MDLYQPLYSLRPEVAPETFVTLRPQVHTQDLGDVDAEFRRAANQPGNRLNINALGGMTGGAGGMGGGGFGGASGSRRGVGGGAGFFGAGQNDLAGAAAPLDPASGVESAAQGEAVGELFRYQIDTPVALKRQQSAMLPIVNESVKAEKISLYNPTVQAAHPMNAAYLANTTSLHLMQGPITLFDGGEYAGDARIEDVAPSGPAIDHLCLGLGHRGCAAS